MSASEANPMDHLISAADIEAHASAAPHPARSILTEIEDMLRDLDAIPAHIAAVVKAKLAEAKSKL